MKLRVISQPSETTYTLLTLKGAWLRNLMRFIDGSGTYLLGAIVCACSSRRRRLGDMAAKTLVVSKESVPYLTMPRQRIRYGARVMAILCLVIAVGSPTFAYFWQPPIFIQNNIAIKALYPNDQITHYTLGEKSWGHDKQGQQSVSYPINFISTYLPANKTHECKGVVTLTWQWLTLSWQEDPSSIDVTCHDR